MRPTSSDFRALCAELAVDLEEWMVATDHRPPSSVELLNRARAELATPPPEPVAPIPVSERLPGPEDLDPNGRCWVYQNEKSTTHWLPANALPFPENND